VLICYIVPNNIFEITIFDDKFEIVFELTSLEIFEIKVVSKLQFLKLLYSKYPYLNKVNYSRSVLTTFEVTSIFDAAEACIAN